METNEGAKIAICTAPPGLYAVIKNVKSALDHEALYALQVVTAFKYTYYGYGTKIFSEPLVYCNRKNANALVVGKSAIEFVGSYENCVLKIKEFISLHYARKNRKNRK